jgi:hypothetical protein
VVYGVPGDKPLQKLQLPHLARTFTFASLFQGAVPIHPSRHSIKELGLYEQTQPELCNDTVPSYCSQNPWVCHLPLESTVKAKTSTPTLATSNDALFLPDGERYPSSPRYDVRRGLFERASPRPSRPAQLRSPFNTA